MGWNKSSRQPRSERKDAFGYAAVKVRCNCDIHLVGRTSAGEYYCKRCGKLFDYELLESEVYETVEDMALCSLRIISDTGKTETEIFAETPKSPAAETGEHEWLSRDDLLARISELEESVARAREERDSEVSRILSENKALKDSNLRLESECSDLEQSLIHQRAEIERLKSVNVRGIADAFLEFSAGTYNTVMDNDDLDTIRKFTEIRLERFNENLSVYGLYMHMQKRGDILEKGRMDITEITTDDPSKDLTVARSIRFGCEFKTMCFADIPESVVVYRYRNPETQDGITSEGRRDGISDDVENQKVSE